MKPNFPDLVNFEYYASKQEPSIEGSSIMSLHTIEHVYNIVSKRDPLNNQIQFQALSTMAQTFAKTESGEATRPVPLDRVHQLYLFAQQMIENIANNPSRKLMKETAYIMPNQLKTPRTKTMNWIAKQPGRNIREKIAGKRVLAEKTVFVVDTKENKVFYRVVTQLSKEFQNRLAFGVDENAYDLQSMDKQRIAEMKRFLSVFKKVKYSELGELDITKPVIEPNNRLISDKNYAPIWRLYNELNNRKFDIQKNSEHLYSRFEDLAYMYVALTLHDYEALLPVDLPLRIEDQIAHLQAAAYEQEVPLELSYFYESAEPVQDEKIVRVKVFQLGLKRIICETSDGQELIIPASDFPSLAHFGRLRQAEWFSLKTYEPSTPAANKATEAFFARLTMQQSPDKALTISRLKRVGNKYSVEKSEQLQFSIVARDGELQSQRGLPITLELVRGNQSKHFEVFADIKGLNDIVSVILQEVAQIAPFSPQKLQSAEEEPKQIEKLAMDFTRHVASLHMNNELISLEQHYLMCYERATVEQSTLVQPNPRYLYELTKQQTSLFDSFDVNHPQYKANVSNFTNLIQRLHATQHINPSTPFIYMVPDNIDEFSQVDIKKALNIYYKKSFPIWRSVAGALTAQQAVAKKQLKRIIVIDTQGPQVSATQLHLVEKNGQTLFMHYPSYEVDAALEKKLTLHNLCQTYARLYNEKYDLALSEQVLQNLVTSGMIERCIINKKQQLVLTSNEMQPFYLIYDKALYANAIQQWLEVYEHYLVKLRAVSKSNGVTTTVISLMDFDVDAVLLDAVHERILQNIPVYRYETAELLQTVSDERVLSKLLKSEPIWYEYLPDLSLDVIRDGTYDSLQLIKDQFIGNTMGAHELFEIEETLVLSAGQASYLFPLKRGGSLGGKINAVIKHSAFPLKTDLEMGLAIEYKYGYENSYRLMLKPLEKHIAIKELEVQWVQEEKSADNTSVHGYLEVPSGILSLVEIEDAKRYIDEVLEKALEIKYAFIQNDIVRTNSLFALKNMLFKAVYTVRKLLRQEDPAVRHYLIDIVRGEAYAYLKDMKHIIPQNILKGKREGVFLDLFKNALRFVYSFGEHIPREYIDKLIMQFMEDKKGYVEQIYAVLYRNADYRPLLQTVEQSIIEHSKTAIRSLRDSVWRDPNILQQLYEQNYKIVESMYGEIKRELKLSAQRKQVRNMRYTRDCLEVLLAMLALRNEPKFEFLQAGSEKAFKLAKNIRDVDVVLYNQMQCTTPTLLQFELEKPEGLWKLSDMGFVLNAYLTGEVKGNLISVRAITDEGNER